MMDVAGIDIGGAGGARPMKNVAVAGAVDRHVGPDGLAAFLALEENTGHRAIPHQGLGAPGVQQQMRAGFEHQFLRGKLQVFGVDGGGPGDDAVVGGGAFLPVGGGRLIGAAP